MPWVVMKRFLCTQFIKALIFFPDTHVCFFWFDWLQKKCERKRFSSVKLQKNGKKCIWRYWFLGKLWTSRWSNYSKWLCLVFTRTVIFKNMSLLIYIIKGFLFTLNNLCFSNFFFTKRYPLWMSKTWDCNWESKNARKN